MSLKSHLYFKNPQEGVAVYKQRQGGGGNNNEREEESDYRPMANDFLSSLKGFSSDVEYRHSRRTLDVPVHFDLIEIEFFGCFDQPNFESKYLNSFGIALVHLSCYNRKGLFVIRDKDKFDVFFSSIHIFIDNANNHRNDYYDPKIRFIKSFKLYGSKEMVRSVNNFNVLHFSIINSLLTEMELINPQKETLLQYLEERGVSFHIEEYVLEVYNASCEILNEIVDNFDIIYATCSGSGAIVRPTAFNTANRDYGFEIKNHEDNLPIIGVIDTGVSNITPLAPILEADANEYDLTGTGAFFDNTDHGTAVACLAALGNRLIPGYRGEVESDAKILSIKISDGTQCPISQQKVVDKIWNAYMLRGVRIFTLTIGYTDFPLMDNQENSSFAFALDRLANELDILIFISTTNNFNNIDDNSGYPAKFLDEDANIAPPGESYNNITVGASNANYEDVPAGVKRSGLDDFPAIYSRKSHHNFKNEDISNSRCKHLVKPDILMPGGDYEACTVGYICGGDASMEVLSSDLRERTYRNMGTSFSAPLAANLAARILRKYPEISMQGVKALMINSSVRPKMGKLFSDLGDYCEDRVVGHGIPDVQRMLSSDENQVTLLLEDEIEIGTIKSFDLNIPEYLNEAKRENGLLKIKATLCFKFSPIENIQLLYCPVHMGFSICKNMPLTSDNGEETINGAGSKDIKLSNIGWSQDYFKRAPAVSNTQKVEFNVKKDCIVQQGNKFKVVINSAFHKLMPEHLKEAYLNNIPFSLVFNIEQRPVKDEELRNLHEELIAVNDVVLMADVDIDIELDA